MPQMINLVEELFFLTKAEEEHNYFTGQLVHYQLETRPTQTFTPGIYHVVQGRLQLIIEF